MVRPHIPRSPGSSEKVFSVQSLSWRSCMQPFFAHCSLSRLQQNHAELMSTFHNITHPLHHIYDFPSRLTNPLLSIFYTYAFIPPHLIARDIIQFSFTSPGLDNRRPMRKPTERHCHPDPPAPLHNPSLNPCKIFILFPFLILFSAEPHPCLPGGNQYFGARTYPTTLLVWPSRGIERREEAFWNVFLEDAKKDK